jgi:hypothetical protein
MPGPKGILWTGWSSCCSLHSGKAPPHARCCTSVVSIISLKNHTDSSLGKPHILINYGQGGRHTPSDEFQLTESSGHIFQGSWFIFSAGWLGNAHLCPKMTSERWETKDDVGPQMSLQTLWQWGQHKCSHAWWAVSSGLVYVHLPRTPTGSSSSEFCLNRQLGLEKSNIWAWFDPPLLLLSNVHTLHSSTIAECKLLKDALMVEAQTGIEVQSHHAHI